MLIAVIHGPKGYRVHADGCRDILHDQLTYGTEAFYTDAQTREGLYRALYGAFYAASYPVASQAWETACRVAGALSVDVLRCCAALPAEGIHIDPRTYRDYTSPRRTECGGPLSYYRTSSDFSQVTCQKCLEPYRIVIDEAAMDHEIALGQEIDRAFESSYY